MQGLREMKHVFTLPEMIVCGSLAIVGAYLLEEGVADSSKTASVLVLAGAAFLAIGIVTLQAGVRSILWHRAMLRRAINREADAMHEIASSQE